MVARADRLTIDTFWQKYGNKPYELIDGTAVRASFKNPLCGLILSCATRELGSFIEQYGLGQLMINVGFALGPTTLYAADLAFITDTKLETMALKDNYVPFAPDLMIKIVAHQDKAQEVQDRVSAFLDAGSLYVWLIYARSGQVVVYDTQKTAKTYGLDDYLSGSEVLPGFEVPVSDLFPSELMDISEGN